jgi:hypothetical protein
MFQYLILAPYMVACLFAPMAAALLNRDPLFTSPRADESTKHTTNEHTTRMVMGALPTRPAAHTGDQPFTQCARIPATAHVTTTRLEKSRLVNVTTVVKETVDVKDRGELPFGVPVGLVA